MIKQAILIFFLFISISSLEASEFDFALKPKEKYAIDEIITTMGENSLAWLFFDKRRLTELGNSIQHIPPLQFLAHILMDDYLKHCLREIQKSHFKWNAFIDGFARNMDREYEKGTLLSDLQGFSELIGADYSRLESLSHRHKWDHFVKVLIY